MNYMSFLLFLGLILAVSAASWTKQNPTPSAAYFQNIVWGNVNGGVYVIGGFRGGLSLLYSSNGQDWSSANYPSEGYGPSYEVAGITVSLTWTKQQGFLVNLFYEVGSYILQSNDGVNWSQWNQTGGNTCNELQQIYTTNGVYLPSVYGGEPLCISTDGREWNSYSTVQNALSALYPLVTINGQTMFVAGYYVNLGAKPNSLVYASANGLNWTLIADLSSETGSDGALTSFVQGDGYYLAAITSASTYYQKLYKSNDLKVWSSRMTNDVGIAQIGGGGGYLWYSYQQLPTSPNKVWVTKDGDHFNETSLVPYVPQYVPSQKLWVSLGAAHISVSSAPLTSWINMDLGIVNFIELFGFNPLTDEFVLQVGSGMAPPFESSFLSNDTTTFYTSSDSSTWTKVSEIPAINVGFSNEFGAWIGVNYDKNSLNAAVTYTKDFQTWKTLSMPSLPWDYSMLSFSNSYVVYVDGTWTMILGFVEDGIFSDDINGLIYSSTDGKNWNQDQNIAYTVNSEIGGLGFGPLIYGNGIYVLLSFDTGIYTSQDRINWQLNNTFYLWQGATLEFVSDGSSLDSGSFFLCVGQYCHVSKDGQHWEEIEGLKNVLSFTSISPSSKETIYAATDLFGFYWTSPDGISWTQGGQISTNTAFNFLACNTKGLCGAASDYDSSIYTGSIN
eukprot:TRINITY_DN108_c0_g2_i2.p1 TRINITY_DN108_c0_g2~~TRINITY_DN108_c0_g2_i2.p1  ORF type:complete len:671 (+),score=56.28 TRINITY_DN108_c0_g2_i2:1649-3661(+)